MMKDVGRLESACFTPFKQIGGLASTDKVDIIMTVMNKHDMAQGISERYRVNPSGSTDLTFKTLTMHLTSLKNDSISYSQGFQNEHFHLGITMYFFHLSPTSIHLNSLQVKNCDSNSRFVVNEDDNSGSKG